MNLSSTGKRLWTWAWIIFALAFLAAYSNFFGNSFQFDDFHTVTDNPAIRSLKNIPRFFTDTTTFSVLPTNQTYRPVVSTSLALDYALGHGYSLFWFHLSTWIWFVVLLGSLFLLYSDLFGNVELEPMNAWFALIATTWFGLHPAMAETVNYVIQRGDLYCTLGCVGALVLYVRYPGLRKSGIYLLPLVLALLSKPPAVIFPALLFLYVLFFEQRSEHNRWLHALLSALPSVVVTALLMILQSVMTPKSFAPSIVSAWQYRITQPYVWLRYFSELFLPIHLNVDTDLQPFDHITLHAIAGFLFVIALLAAIAFTSCKKHLYPIAYGLLWFVLTQLPTSLYTLSEVENDHRMFFSFAGLIPAMIWAGVLLYRRLTSLELRAKLRPTLAVCLILVLGTYAFGTHHRNTVWHTEESLWKDDVEKSPHNGRGLMIYGVTLLNRGDFHGAKEYFDRALLYTPNYPTLEINLGVVNGGLGAIVEAEKHFRRAILLAPNDDTAHSFYGRWLSNAGRTGEAETQLKTAIQLNPHRAMQRDVLLDLYSRTNLAAMRDLAGDTLQAIPDDALAQNLLQRPPQLQLDQPQQSVATAANVDDLINQSLSLYQQGQFKACIAMAQTALKINPNSAEAWNNIAAGHASLKEWDEAIVAARKAIALRRDFQMAKNNLAWAEDEKKKAGKH